MKKNVIWSLLCWVPIVLSSSNCRPFNDLRAHYDENAAKDSFYELPETTRHPLIQNYERVNVDCPFPVHVYCYPKDPRVCLMYDYNGYIAGVQVSFLFKDTAHIKNLNYSAAGFIYSDIFDQEAWAFRVYFTNPETLTPAGRHKVEEVAEGVWVYLDKKLTKIPRKEPKNKSQFGPFYRQTCIPKCGKNYQYKMNRHSDVKDLPLVFNLCYDQGSFVSFGVGTFGKETTAKREWYDYLTFKQISRFIPNHPPCFLKWVKKYGFMTFTLILVDNPWEISCPQD